MQKAKKLSKKKRLGEITLATDEDVLLRHFNLGPYSRGNSQVKGRHKAGKVFDENPQVAYADLPAVNKMLRGLVERKMLSHVVLARNETVYAYNEATAKLNSWQNKKGSN